MPDRDPAAVRPEEAGDRAAVRRVNEAAFGGSEEADLVDRLRADGLVLLSLVAEADAEVVGHIMFSRMAVDTAAGELPAVALAPMAVAPAWQRRGVGGQLVRQGLDRLREMGERIVIVVGHPEYYPRFGFSSAQARALDSPFPPDPFMALALSPGALEGIRGRVRYPAAFGV